MSSSDRAQLSAGEAHGLMKILLDTIGHPESPKPEELPATHLPSSSPPPEPPDGPMDVEQPLPSIYEPDEPFPVSGQVDVVSPNRGDKLNELWLKPINQLKTIYTQNRRGHKSHVRRRGSRARTSRGLTMGGWTSCNCYRLSLKRRRPCRAQTMYHRAEVTR